MNSKKILLVEDESIEAMDIKRTLESFGYQVPYVASKGEEAVEKASELMPDLILMDIVLKGEINGIEAVSEIENLNIPFIYLTAHSEESTIERAKLTSPAGYIIKPYDPMELKYAVELAIYKNQMEKELKESEKRYRSIVDNVLDAYLRGDKDGNIIMASPSAANMYGFNSPEEMIGISAISLYKYPIARQKMLENLKKHGKVLNMGGKALRKDGTSFWASMNVQYVYDDEGRIQGTEAFVRDITNTKVIEKKLNDSRKYYRAIFEHTGTATAILEVDTTISLVNVEFEKLSGYSRKELEGKKSWTEFVAKEDLEKMRDYHNLRRIAPDSAPEVYDFDFIDRDGGVRNIHLTVDIIPGTEKSVASLLDVTDLKTTQKSLEKNVSRFRALAEYAIDGIITTDAHGSVLYFNNSLMKMFGYNKDELKDSQLVLLMPERYRKKFIDSLKKVRTTGEHSLVGKIIETMGLKKDGNEFPFEMSLTKWEVENEIYFTSIIRDISERKKGEELREIGEERRKRGEKALRESENKYKSLFESNPDYTILVDLDGVILDVNYSAENFTNLSKNELIGKNYLELELFPKKSLLFLIDKFDHVSKCEIIEPFQFQLINKEGNLSWVETKLVPLMRDGHLNSIMVIATDITARKMATEQLKLSINEKEALLREIHHRVKNNMQIISSILNLQKQSVENDEFVNVLMESQNRIKSMAMIHERLYLSGDLTRINFSEYIERLVSDLSYSYAQSARQVTQVIDVENLRLNIETAVPCGLIISELVSNSLKHAFPDGKKGTLTVSLKSHEGWNELFVADDGIGLPERMDIESTETLGFQLVNNLVNQLDGEITLDRSHGTVFKIIFKELKYKERISAD